MTDPERPSPTEELHKRVKAAQERNTGVVRNKKARSSSVGTGMGVGVKVGVDLVVGVGVGAAIGWGLDWWLETKPILLVIFLIFGFIAGLMNVVRTANQSFKSSGTNSGN
ncbi:MAG: F0F1 ATP synthase subunit I [Rhodospirillaceae bacterium]|nr:F0F1 ATP synthase subunit I [Rhodospirillaceae bacterium]|tara:strand:- start:25139 stop:25468 length:330 start_codon:yes stop_codon:yes gene_type:complete